MGYRRMNTGKVIDVSPKAMRKRIDRLDRLVQQGKYHQAASAGLDLLNYADMLYNDVLASAESQKQPPVYRFRY